MTNKVEVYFNTLPFDFGLSGDNVLRVKVRVKELHKLDKFVNDVGVRSKVEKFSEVSPLTPGCGSMECIASQ